MRTQSREIVIPFQINSQGAIGWTEDRAKQTSQHILSVVATNPGERVMRPTYGVPLTRMLFEPDNALVQADIRSRMELALSQWASGVEIVGITPMSRTSEDALIEFHINFRLPGSSDINTATIAVGGTVTEIKLSV